MASKEVDHSISPNLLIHCYLELGSSYLCSSWFRSSKRCSRRSSILFGHKSPLQDLCAWVLHFSCFRITSRRLQEEEPLLSEARSSSSTWALGDSTMEVFSMKQTILSILVCLQGSDRRYSTYCCRVIPWRLCHFQKSSRSLSHPRDHCIPLRTTLSLLQPSIVFDKGFLLDFWVWVLDEKGSGFAGARFYCSSYCCACLTILIIWALVLHFAS